MSSSSTILWWLLHLFPQPESVHWHRPPCSQWEASQSSGYFCICIGLFQGAGTKGNRPLWTLCTFYSFIHTKHFYLHSAACAQFSFRSFRTLTGLNTQHHTNPVHDFSDLLVVFGCFSCRSSVIRQVASLTTMMWDGWSLFLPSGKCLQSSSWGKLPIR